MFSILVSELTPDMLSKAPCWAFMGVPDDSGVPMWKAVHQPRHLKFSIYGTLSCTLNDEEFAHSTSCFPVALSPDGTEARLECPRMPDEPMIEGIPDDWYCGGQAEFRQTEWHWFPQGHLNSIHRIAPTPEHYPRLSLEGVWVWSTRR